MTEEEKNEAVTGAVEDCLSKAVDILEANKGGVTALFALFVDEKGVSVRKAGHTMALDSVYHKALQIVIAELLQLPEAREGR